MRKAAGSSDPDLYHLWRKRAKDHWYHVRLLSELWGETSQSREGCLHDLETALGDDHNLEVLCAEVSEDSDAFGDKGAAELFTAAARAKQQRLRARALELGERLYEPKPKELIRDFERMWDIWRAEPEELTAAAT
jgi:CHAD domain-containing protein